jgi:MOSC domain-containing protein
MTKPIGRVVEIVRYPVKSMAGVASESAFLGWHGLSGDRRFAFRRVGDKSGIPWLSASRLADLILYQPCGFDERNGEPLPTHVRTPAGVERELWSAELQREVAERFGSEVELMQVRHGVFDDATISIVSTATIAGVSRESGVAVDSRRFRANIVIECDQGELFLEEKWMGGTLVFGEKGPAVRVTMRDTRCAMLNLDPKTAEPDARVLKTVVRLNQNNAGVYGTVLRTGKINVGESVSLVMDDGA